MTMIERLLSQDGSSSKAIAATLLFTFASFLANFGVAVTGFGMALIFLFVYTIADLAGFLQCDNICGIKDAVFLQSLSLASAAPLLLWASRDKIQKYANKTLLLAFIPATIIGTPIGNWMQDYLPSEAIRIIVGAMITLYCSYQVVKLKTQWKDSTDHHSQPITFDTEAVRVVLDASSLEEAASAAETTTPTENVAPAENSPVDETQPEQSGIKFWVLAFVVGFLAGFLGGLNGVRSGPVLIFFLHYEYSKDVIRSNLMILTTVNTYVRFVYYIVEDQTGQAEESSSWFDPTIWYLYVAVAIAGWAAIPAGLWVEKRIRMGAFNVIIVVCLLVTGVLNITKGAMELST